MTQTEDNRLDSLSDSVQKKYLALRSLLLEYKSIIVAYSGGVDSAFLAAVANNVLKGNALAVSAVSPSFAESEREEAKSIAEKFGFRHLLVESKEMDNPDFVKNDAMRCAHCKDALMNALKIVGEQEGIEKIAIGAIVDDMDDYRPGESAAQSHGAVFPLREAGFTKQDIREVSKAIELPTWDKPAGACLASRVPYGSSITDEKLYQIARAEAELKKMGFKIVRVRHHGEIARIELGVDEIPKMIGETATSVNRALKELGFTFVTLDLAGYRTGSLNESLA